jgi:hypothetical protein
MPSSWERAYREYLNGHNGHGDPLSFEQFCGRLSPISGETFSKPEKEPAKPPLAPPPPATSDDPLDYDLNAEGAFGALVPANSKKKTPFANPHYETRTDKPLAGRNQGKAEREGVYRPDNVGKIEEHRARGHTKVAGKHVRADGLVSRSGFPRILPGDDDDTSNVDADLAAETAKEVLRGREATIFEKRLVGVKIEALAQQFGRSVGFIHGVIEKSRIKVMQAIQRKLHPPKGDESCPTCGYVYGKLNQLPCARGYGFVAGRDLAGVHPECRRRYDEPRHH